MSALGMMILGFGVLTIWAGLDRQSVFDVLRSFIGAPTPSRDTKGKITGFPKNKTTSA
jgi:hypothetical protein